MYYLQPHALPMPDKQQQITDGQKINKTQSSHITV